MTRNPCPCGNPERGYLYRKDGKHIYACSMRCLKRLAELKGVVPDKNEAAQGAHIEGVSQ
jgi:hypothetical protein